MPCQEREELARVGRAPRLREPLAERNPIRPNALKKRQSCSLSRPCCFENATLAWGGKIVRNAKKFRWNKRVDSLGWGAIFHHTPIFKRRFSAAPFRNQDRWRRRFISAARRARSSSFTAVNFSARP
jgi:hypothetical protein